MYRPLKFLSKWTKRAAAHAESGGQTAPGIDDDALRAIFAATSWLIDYPDEDLLDRLPQISALLDHADVPDHMREDLGATISHLRGGDPIGLRADYVETFDTRRRGCLFLTYFSNGDTRKRGQALLEIKEIYRTAGLDMDETQLPDHLSYVLEFAAGHDLDAGVRILLANRAGIELLRLHLTEIGSPWAGTIRAVCATLPALDSDDIHAVERLAAEGPTTETVGLDGLGGYGDAPPSAAETAAAMATAPDASMPPRSAQAAPGGCSAGGGRTFIPLAEVTGERS
ncbi:respiratory nitrate reductase chaperone NarJ [Brevibacterium siliguriense]|uniref:Respiratory nitrate reductase chaperone NarJ n=1 Tax=Brevibacterium siliguriense TaxID=1136497 RepID=A0A1H1P2Z0_9MICO|nr:nitrate reductase molybdenum cofactor assembly chaperone [Brevibacterium siliguriense]SDS05618.1 respiratory nitrate reductase chaperone NarJ [Brevibacterium siliguriense]